ncbi:MAG: hypothetical protein KBF98_02910 [Rhodoferax sp.]|nr:hypothetical protein [Rhodoferax sp.]
MEQGVNYQHSTQQIALDGKRRLSLFDQFPKGEQRPCTVEQGNDDCARHQRRPDEGKKRMEQRGQRNNEYQGTRMGASAEKGTQTGPKKHGGSNQKSIGNVQRDEIGNIAPEQNADESDHGRKTTYAPPTWPFEMRVTPRCEPKNSSRHPLGEHKYPKYGARVNLHCFERS